MMEVFKLLPEGTNAQLIRNQIVMSPAPSDAHQEVAGEIHAQLHLFVTKNALGKVRSAPYDVYLNRKNAYQPFNHHYTEAGLPKTWKQAGKIIIEL